MSDAPAAPKPMVGCALAVGLVLLGLGACSPALNWRNATLTGTSLQALMPCKPERGERLVPLADPPVTMRLQSCEAAGMHFVLGWVDVGAPERLPRAVALWRQGSLASLGLADAPGAGEPPAAGPPVVEGAEQVWSVAAQGRDAQARPWQTRALYFTQGTRAFQAAVYGAELPDEALEAFFSGLKLR